MQRIHGFGNIDRSGMAGFREFVREERRKVVYLTTGTFTVMTVFGLVAASYFPALNQAGAAPSATATAAIELMAYDLTAARQFSNPGEQGSWLPANFYSNGHTSFR